MRTVSPASNIQNEPTINVETTMNVEPTMNVDNNYMDENNPNYIINDDWINELRDFVENLDEEDIEQIFNVNDTILNTTIHGRWELHMKYITDIIY